MLAAVSSVVVARFFLGADAMFQIPAYRMVHPLELVTYAVLGVVGGGVSLLFAKLLIWIRTQTRSLPRWTLYVQPAIAGLAIGIVALKFPQVMGAGYEYMDQAMHGQFLWQILMVLALLKVLATSLSLSSTWQRPEEFLRQLFSSERWSAPQSALCNIAFSQASRGRWAPTHWWAWARFSQDFCAYR